MGKWAGVRGGANGGEKISPRAVMANLAPVLLGQQHCQSQERVLLDGLAYLDWDVDS